MIHQAIRGTVYGVVLNDTVSLDRIGSLEAAPYKGTPRAPVLYIKPANTHAADGASVALPAGEPAVEVAATIGLVMGRAAARLDAGSAMDAVGGIVLAADLSLPHEDYYRPAIRQKCFDGALPISSVHAPRDLNGLVVNVEIDGQAVDRFALADLLRSPAQLLTDVTEFMTLNAGDVLLVGVHYMAPQAAAGSAVRIHAEGLGELQFTLNKGASA